MCGGVKHAVVQVTQDLNQSATMSVRPPASMNFEPHHLIVRQISLIADNSAAAVPDYNFYSIRCSLVGDEPIVMFPGINCLAADTNNVRTIIPGSIISFEQPTSMARPFTLTTHINNSLEAASFVPQPYWLMMTLELVE